MRKILIQNHYWKLFWSLIPKLVLFFFMLSTKYLYRVLKCINLTFGYPKDSGSGAQHKNPRPNLEAVTKTDSNNVFGLKLWAFLTEFWEKSDYYGTILDYFLILFNIFWKIVGQSLDICWTMSRQCFDHFWTIFGLFLTIFGPFLDYFWTIFGPF